MKHWILVGQTPIEVGLDEWARWFETNERYLWKTLVGTVTVSTVFLGIDHSMSIRFDGEHIPQLFETMVFDKNGDELFTYRWRSYLQAENGHRQTCLDQAMMQ